MDLSLFQSAGTSGTKVGTYYNSGTYYPEPTTILEHTIQKLQQFWNITLKPPAALLLTAVSGPLPHHAAAASSPATIMMRATRGKRGRKKAPPKRGWLERIGSGFGDQGQRALESG